MYCFENWFLLWNYLVLWYPEHGGLLPEWWYTDLSPNFSVGGHLGGFQHFAIISMAIMRILLHFTLCACINKRQTLRHRIPGFKYAPFEKHCQIVHQKVVSIYFCAGSPCEYPFFFTSSLVLFVSNLFLKWEGIVIK